jgi:hypothetical protein
MIHSAFLRRVDFAVEVATSLAPGLTSVNPDLATTKYLPSIGGLL